MNIYDVRARVADIARMAGDDEAAHSAEDTLWGEVLRAIADGNTDDPQGIAKEALRTADISFARWRA